MAPVSRRAKGHVNAAQRHRADQDYTLARSELEKALSIINRGPPWHSSPIKQLRWHHAHADLLAGLGEVGIELGRPDLACDAFEQSLREYSGLTHAESVDISTTYNNLGVVYGQLGRLDESAAVLRKAMDIDRRIGREATAIAATLNNIALTYQAAGYHEAADRALEEASRLAGLPPGAVQHLDEQRSFHLMTRGDFAHALVRMRERLDAVPAGSIQEAFLAGDLALAYAELQRWKDAEVWHRRAVQVRRRLQPGSMPLAIALSNAAATLDALGRPAEAEACWREAASLAERIAPHSGALAAIRGSLIFLLIEQGDPAAAARLAKLAVDSAPAANRQLSGVYMAAAAAFQQLGEPDQARTMLEHARDACAWISPLLPELGPILTALGWNMMNRGDLDKAAECFDQAIRVAESRRAGAAAEPGLELLFGTAKTAYHGRILVAHERDTPAEAAEAFRAVESFRARTLAELLSSADDGRRPAPAAAEVVAGLDSVRRELGTLYRRREVDSSPALLRRRDELEQEAERLRVRLRALAPDVADRESPGPCTVDDIQRCLDQGTLLAVYEVTEDGIFCFTITRTTFRFTRLRAGTDEVAAAVEEVMAACRTSGTPAPEAALRRLGAWLLGPLDGSFGKLAVCANDILAYLPFQALPRDGVVLAERCDIWSVPSATTVVRFGRNRQRRQPTQDFVGFAVSDTPGTNHLPSAVPEVREIANLFRGTATVLVNDEVTAAAIGENARHGRFVHFAMHGEISDTRPLYSGFPLGADEFLPAYEMTELDLCAELVSCAACETAVGESRAGEGVVGLAYALFSAGAQAVLVSRWPIADRVARRMMVAVYGELAAGTPPALALGRAALQVRGTQRHPRDWAAFDLIDIDAPGSSS